ncbi:hypothetical protein [Burkholderia cenocepacia]|uniref:hypothetical protein n=1 Tax=Burkholderia cenocepacia TaxID=95486 RepID=UPI0021AB5F4A|nr:hypothetical protein [Burkholderia cenocepacia]
MTDIAGQRRRRHAERGGRPERRRIGQQPDLVPGIHQRAAERRERTRVAFGAVGGDDEFHAELLVHDGKEWFRKSARRILMQFVHFQSTALP